MVSVLSLQLEWIISNIFWKVSWCVSVSALSRIYGQQKKVNNAHKMACQNELWSTSGLLPYKVPLYRRRCTETHLFVYHTSWQLFSIAQVPLWAMKKSGTKRHNRTNFSIYHLHGPFFFHVFPHNNVVFTGFSWVSRVCMLKRADGVQRYICHFTLLSYRILNCAICSIKTWCCLSFIKL